MATHYLACKDVGMDCDHVVEGETEDEVLAKAGEHARAEHGLTEPPSAEMVAALKSKIIHKH